MNEIALKVTALDAGPVTVDEILRRREVVSEVIRRLFREGVHFGTIPGTKEPGLWQAGAELIAAVFGLAVEGTETHEIVGGHVVYTATARLSVIATGAFVGSLKGICSTGEEKFAWRHPVCRAEYVAENVKGRARLKFRKGSEEPEEQVATSLEDARNSAMKRAVKRALVAAIRTATGTSDLFAEGEDDDENGQPRAKKAKGKAEPNVGQVSGSVEEVDGAPTATWWGVKIAGHSYRSEDKALRAIAFRAHENGLRVSLTFQVIEGAKGSWKKVLSVKAIEAAAPAGAANSGEPS